MMWDGMPAFGWLWVTLWLVFAIGLLVLVVLAIIWLARNMGSGNQRPSGKSTDSSGPASAMEALDMRYARGEISREEYLQAREDLKGPER